MADAEGGAGDPPFHDNSVVVGGEGGVRTAEMVEILDHHAVSALLRLPTFEGLSSDDLANLEKAAAQLAAHAVQRKSSRAFKRMMDVIMKCRDYNLRVAAAQVAADQRERGLDDLPISATHNHLHLHGNATPTTDRRRTEVDAMRRRLVGSRDGGDADRGNGSGNGAGRPKPA